MIKIRFILFSLAVAASIAGRGLAAIFELTEPMQFTQGTYVNDQTLNPSFQQHGTVFAEINPDALPSGYSDDSPPTILRLRNSTSGELLLLCIKNAHPHLAVRGKDNQWIEYTAQQSLTEGQKAQVAVVFSNQTARLFVNGMPDPSVQRLDAAAYDLLEPGRNFKNRRFIGTMSKLMITDEIFSSDELAKKAGTLFAAQQSSAPDPVPATAPEFPRYKALLCVSNEMQLINGGIGEGVAVAWDGPQDCSLLVSTQEGYLGDGTFLYHVIGRRADGMPEYRMGERLNIRGKKFQQVVLPDGRFDLLASKGQKIYLYRNSGTPGHPEFKNAGEDVTPVLRAVTAAPLGDWSIGDMNGDGIPDMLLTTGRQKPDSFWPDYENPWRQKELPNTGYGKGYDICGNWLGEKFNSGLYVAKGRLDDQGEIRFDLPQKVFLGSADFQVQWRQYLPMTPALLHSAGQKWIVLFGDCDRLLALPVLENSSDIRCGNAVPLLKDDVRMIGSYFTSALSCADFDGDGQEEVFAYGNSGRAVILKGTRPGDFTELAPLRYQGGFVAGDPLAVPCRVDWDQDGFQDLLIGDASGYLTFRPGTASPTVYGPPQWLRSNGQIIFHQAGPTGSFQGPPERRWGYLQPVAADWDGDGKLDVIVNDINAQMQLYRHGATTLDLQSAEPFTLQNSPLPVAWRSRPAVLEGAYRIAGDDRPCLLYMNVDGDLAVAVPEIKGSTRISTSTLLKYATGDSIRISALCGMWGRTKFAVCDWDMDGRWDVLFGTNKGTQRAVKSVKPGTNATPFFMRNIGTNDKPVFEYPQPIKLRSGQLLDFDVHVCAVWPTDLDNDGKPDLIIGGEDGRVYYFYRSELDI